MAIEKQEAKARTVMTAEKMAVRSGTEHDLQGIRNRCFHYMALLIDRWSEILRSEDETPDRRFEAAIEILHLCDILETHGKGKPMEAR